MSEWKEYNITDVCDTISDTYKDGATKVVLVNTSDVLEGKVTNHEFVPNKNLAGQFKKKFQKDDILYSEIRPANRRYAYVDFEPKNYIASTKLMVLRSKPCIFPKYLYYLLTNNTTIHNLHAIAVGRSGTFPQITYSELANIKFRLPSLDEQDKILTTLLYFDDKIAVNRRICENLEAQAQALFKHWFIDFAPFKNGKFVESKLGMIPEGWRVMSIDDIYSIKYGKNLPTSKIKEKGDYPVYGANGIMGYYNTYNYDNYVTLITSRGSGSGDVSRTFQKKAFITNNSFAVNPKDNYSYLGCGYTYYCIKNINFKPFCSGSAQPQLTNTSISAISILLPDKNVVIKYNSLASYIQKEINQAYIESNRLATLRDTLLPKLMSGQIKVNETEKSL